MKKVPKQQPVNTDALEELENEREGLRKKLAAVKAKHKGDLDIKDQQIKLLKIKVEDLAVANSQLKEDENINMPLQVQSEKAAKKERIKARKYEQIIRGCLQAVAGIGQQVVKLEKGDSMPCNQKSSSSTPMLQADEHLYQDSVDILGVSLGELEQFMNPALSDSKQKQSKIKAILQKLKDILE